MSAISKKILTYHKILSRCKQKKKQKQTIDRPREIYENLSELLSVYKKHKKS